VKPKAQPPAFVPISRPLPPAPFDARGLGKLAGELARPNSSVVVRRIDDLDSLVVAAQARPRPVLGLDPHQALRAGLAIACVSLVAVGSGWWRSAREPAPAAVAQSAAPAVRPATPDKPYLGMALAAPAPAPAPKPQARGARRAVEALAAPDVAVASAEPAHRLETPAAPALVEPARPVELAQAAVPAPPAAPTAPAGALLVSYQPDRALLGGSEAGARDRLVEGGSAGSANDPQRLASAIGGF